MRIAAAVLATAGALGVLTGCTGGEPPPTAPTGSPAALSPAPEAAPAPAVCSTAGWEAGAIEATGMSTDVLFAVRAGRHACYDRVVFDMAGPSLVGFSARYVPEVAADASGLPVAVPGGAALEVVVRAPARGSDGGPALAAVGADFVDPAQVANWGSLRGVRFAGSFEGQSTIAVGVRERLPFRVFSLVDPERQTRRVVVDISH